MAVAFAACADGPVNVTAFCAEQGISRQTFYVYRRRFQAEGIQGLLPRSRRPTRSPSRTAEAVAARCVAVHDQLHEQGWDAGARSVRDRMLGRAWPRPATGPSTGSWPRTAGSRPHPKKRRRDSYRRFEAAAPNGMWQLDGTKRALADGTVVCILRVIDDHSRMLLATRVAPSENMADTWALLRERDDPARPAGVAAARRVDRVQRGPPGPRPGHRPAMAAAPAGRAPGRVLAAPPANLRQEGTRLAAAAPLARRPPRRRDHRRPATPGRRLRRGVQHRTPPPRHRPGHPRPALPGHRQGRARPQPSSCPR